MSHKTLFKRLRPLHYSQGLEFQGLRHLSLRKSWPREPLSGLALSVEIGLKVQGLGFRILRFARQYSITSLQAETIGLHGPLIVPL